MDNTSLTSILFETHRPAKLERIPDDPISIIFAFKWIEYLAEKVGYSNIPDVLEFYCNLGWLSDNAVLDLLKFLKGIKVGIEEEGGLPPKLTVIDHLVSLLFIERINGIKISSDILDKLEWELRRVKKGTEDYYGI